MAKEILLWEFNITNLNKYFANYHIPHLSVYNDTIKDLASLSKKVRLKLFSYFFRKK